MLKLFCPWKHIQKYFIDGFFYFIFEPNFFTKCFQNLKIENLKIENPKIKNLKIENLKIENLKIENLKIENLEIWKSENPKIWKMKIWKSEEKKSENLKSENQKIIMSSKYHKIINIQRISTTLVFANCECVFFLTMSNGK